MRVKKREQGQLNRELASLENKYQLLVCKSHSRSTDSSHSFVSCDQGLTLYHPSYYNNIRSLLLLLVVIYGVFTSDI